MGMQILIYGIVSEASAQESLPSSPPSTAVNIVLNGAKKPFMVHVVTSSYYSSPPLLVSTAMKPGKIASFSCHSQASTAVCVPGNPRLAAIVPRRADRALVVDSSPLQDVKYTRLLDGRRYAVGAGGEGSLRSRISAKQPAAVSTISCRSFDRSFMSRPKVVVPAFISRKNQVPGSVKSIIAVPATKAASSNHPFQVVVMRVSIHCQGCAGKVKKILTKMEGVTSFAIDVDSKRVTVMGHVSPVVVLEGVSKVKKAEFWSC